MTAVCGSLAWWINSQAMREHRALRRLDACFDRVSVDQQEKRTHTPWPWRAPVPANELTLRRLRDVSDTRGWDDVLELKSLTHLTVFGCKPPKEWIARLPQLTQLRRLAIEIDEESLNSLPPMSRLIELRLLARAPHRPGASLQTLARQRSLWSLQIHCDEFGDSLRHLRVANSCSKLGLFAVEAGGKSRADLSDLSGCGAVKTLCVDDVAAESSVDFASLRSVEIFSSFCGRFPDLSGLEQATTLTDLRVWNVDWSREATRAASLSPRLEKLYVDDCKGLQTDDIIDWIGMRPLRSLSVQVRSQVAQPGFDSQRIASALKSRAHPIEIQISLRSIDKEFVTAVEANPNVTAFVYAAAKSSLTPKEEALRERLNDLAGERKTSAEWALSHSR